ncbi:MAG: DNA topology modulation protein [Pyrinomonadaceae bacterium]|nr:DNA topology modulation protein [Pyrinomonadaceae bacterium]
MKRVLVVGSCGAGKSTFSRKLQEKTDLPLIHLDRYYWKPDWVESSVEEWTAKVSELISGDKWIIDGNYGGTMDLRMKRADTVIWLDLPRYLCIYRVLKRTLSANSSARPDMAEGCEERFELDFLKYVWNFRRDKNPKIERRFDRVHEQARLIRFRRSSEPMAFLDGLENQCD